MQCHISNYRSQQPWKVKAGIVKVSPSDSHCWRIKHILDSRLKIVMFPDWSWIRGRDPSQCSLFLWPPTPDWGYRRFVWVTKSWLDFCLIFTVDLSGATKPCWLLINQTNQCDSITYTTFKSRLSQKPVLELTGYRVGLNAQGNPQKRLIFTQKDIHIVQVNRKCSALYFSLNLLSFSLLTGPHPVEEKSLWRKGRMND